MRLAICYQFRMNEHKVKLTKHQSLGARLELKVSSYAGAFYRLSASSKGSGSALLDYVT